LKNKCGALTVIALFFMPAVFAFLNLAFAAGDYFLENWNENFAQGIHENTENVDNQIRLVPENMFGRFTSRVLDAGENVRWDNIIWMESEPSAFVQENDNVTSIDNLSNSTIIDEDNMKLSDDNPSLISENADNRLEIIFTIDGVARGFDSYTVIVEAKRSSAGTPDNFYVYVLENRLGTEVWRLIGTIEQTTDQVFRLVISRDNIDNYLGAPPGDNINVKIVDTGDQTSQTDLYIDQLIVMENVTYTSSVKLQVRVSSDNVTWSDNLGPDGTSNTYFETSPASLENIPVGRYIRYVVYFSSENGQLLSGANGPVVDNVIINFTRPTRLVRPADNTQTRDNTPTFGWENRAPNALSYRLVIDNDPYFADGENTYDNANIPGAENSVTIENELPDGVWYWKVRVRSSGGWGPWSEVFRLVVDNTPPSAPVIFSSHPEATWIDNNNPSFSWGAVGGPSDVTYYYKLEGYDTTWRTTTSTSVSYANLPDGTYTFKLYAQDLGGSSTTDSYQIKVDTSAPPTPTISSGTHAEDAVSGNASPSFSWNAVGGPSPVTYYYMLYPYESSWKTTTSTSVSYSNIPDGEYTFKLKASDTGGTSGVDQYTIRIDTAPSTIDLMGVAATATETATGWIMQTDQQVFKLSGRVEPGATVTINGIQVPVAGDGTFSKTLTLMPGRNVFTIRVVDVAGNITEKTLTITYTGIAPTLPQPTVLEPLVLVGALVALIAVVAGVILRFMRRP
jgi:hypothetical protein